ncbi:DUF4189 domain-containing protein [Lysobacter yananisis]|uniref:DUF4189 domain-containing protein n=1 Tax=Lysobacter yananisis TaxID=1003114 RepID=A0ABY9P876_9GAMM|nr:DUF4189 domain-containing protein [Lysobacter yananisis]WMT02578.1 DUF4189 domain-containing protein [Lysobacter yananisis]
MNQTSVAFVMAISAMFLTTSFAAYACPPGSTLQKGNGWEGCVQTGIPSTNSGPAWKTQWGAIATDGSSAALGTAIEASSKRIAERAALKLCKEDGGKNCKIKLAYYNQCASLISGDRLFFVQSAETREEAVSDGLDRCRHAGDTGCSEHYSGCSLPKQVR